MGSGQLVLVSRTRLAMLADLSGRTPRRVPSRECLCLGWRAVGALPRHTVCYTGHYQHSSMVANSLQPCSPLRCKPLSSDMEMLRRTPLRLLLFFHKSSPISASKSDINTVYLPTIASLSPGLGYAELCRHTILSSLSHQDPPCHGVGVLQQGSWGKSPAMIKILQRLEWILKRVEINNHVFRNEIMALLYLC